MLVPLNIFFMKLINWERNGNFNHSGLPVMKVAITLLLMYSSRFLCSW